MSCVVFDFLSFCQQTIGFVPGSLFTLLQVHNVNTKPALALMNFSFGIMKKENHLLIKLTLLDGEVSKWKLNELKIDFQQGIFNTDFNEFADVISNASYCISRFALHISLITLYA